MTTTLRITIARGNGPAVVRTAKPDGTITGTHTLHCPEDQALVTLHGGQVAQVHEATPAEAFAAVGQPRPQGGGGGGPKEPA